MIKRLIRLIAGPEIDRARAAHAAKTDGLRAELAQLRVSVDAAVNLAYANGYNAGRAVGHSEMLTHLRGDPDERVTAEIMQRRAAEMVH